MQSFADMHLHAPQYPMLGMGMDLPLLDWLNTYTFKTEARFADTDYARRVYRRLAGDLITNGTTRVCMFSSLHTEATWILMEELERAGVTGYVGKVNMDRNALPGVLEETTEESVRETIRWLDGCRFEHVRPIITPRFTPQLHRRAHGRTREDCPRARALCPVAPLREHERDRVGARAQPRLRAVLGDV